MLHQSAAFSMRIHNIITTGDFFFESVKYFQTLCMYASYYNNIGHIYLAICHIYMKYLHNYDYLMALQPTDPIIGVNNTVQGFNRLS